MCFFHSGHFDIDLLHLWESTMSPAKRFTSVRAIIEVASRCHSVRLPIGAGVATSSGTGS